MSLLVFGSGSRLAQGVIRNIYKSGKFDSILCADLYSSYWSIQKYQYFRESLEGIKSKTKVSDTKIQDKTGLNVAIKGNTHVLYITHDSYSNCFSKLSLIVQTANIVKELGHVKSFVTYTPVELDHYGEVNPSNSAQSSEDQVRQIFPDVVQIKSDLTFGNDATVLIRLLQRIANEKSISFKPSGGGPSPIHVDNIGEAIVKLLDGTHKGQRIVAQGDKKYDWNALVLTLEKAMTGGHQAKLNSCKIEQVFSPTSNNVFSEFFFDDKYRNLVQFLNQYHPLANTGAKDIKSLGVKPIDFDEFYKPGSVDGHKFRFPTSGLEFAIQKFFY